MTAIRKVTIFGERCSGTNYIEELVTQNFDVQITWDFGWKHFFSFNTVRSGIRQAAGDDSDVLFICIVRNVRDWLDSLHREPHHLPDSMLGKGVKHFLSSPAYSIDRIPREVFGTTDIIYHEIERHDSNIYTGVRYKNIFEMRYTKIKFMRQDLPKLVSNYIFIKYEDLCLDFRDTMHKLHEKGLTLRSPVTFPSNVSYYKKCPDVNFKDTTRAPRVISDELFKECCPLEYQMVEKTLYGI